MEERRDIVYIGIDHIHTHPENPRKDLGDLTELAESMKKAGMSAEFNGCSGRRTAWRVLCIDRKPPAWSIKVGRPGRIAMQDR